MSCFSAYLSGRTAANRHNTPFYLLTDFLPRQASLFFTSSIGTINLNKTTDEESLVIGPWSLLSYRTLRLANGLRSNWIEQHRTTNDDGCKKENNGRLKRSGLVSQNETTSTFPSTYARTRFIS
eukprot:scaffold209_cov251-Chaetoceros_neogracile.AAC.12